MNDKKFAYYKLEYNDLDTIRETLTKEQGFDLLCALVDYSRKGTIAELPADLRIPFVMLKKKVDQAHKAYEDKCSALKENGRKGGKAKAKNAAKSDVSAPDQTKKFNPPTLRQFKNAVEKIAEDNGWDYPKDYDIEAFYDHLNENRWLFEGMAIQSREDWEAIISEKFSGLDIIYYEALCYLISTYPQLHHRWDVICEITDELCESWSDNQRVWIIDNQVFQKGDFRTALDLIVGEWQKEIPP